MVILGRHSPAIFINTPSMQRTPVDRRIHSVGVQPSSCKAYTSGDKHQHPPQIDTLSIRRPLPQDNLAPTWHCWSHSGMYSPGSVTLFRSVPAGNVLSATGTASVISDRLFLIAKKSDSTGAAATFTTLLVLFPEISPVTLIVAVPSPAAISCPSAVTLPAALSVEP